MKVILWLVKVCDPRQQNCKRSTPPSEKFQYCYWENKDKMWLYYNHWETNKPIKGLVFICHGICEHSGRYAAIAQKLNEAGFSVYALDHRGHGRSDGYRNYIYSMKDVVGDTCDFIRYIHEKRSELPVFMLGHSMGGMITIISTYNLKSIVKGSVISAPALMLDPILYRLRWLVNILKTIVPKLPVTRLAGTSMCHDSIVVEQYTYDILCTPGITKPVPARTAWEVASGIDCAVGCEEDFTTPYLLMQGSADSVCLPEGAEKFYKTTKSVDKEYKVWDGCYHEIMNEEVGDDVVNYAIDWLTRHV